MSRHLPVLVLAALFASLCSAQTKTTLSPQIAFEPNEGQASNTILYLNHGARSALALTSQGFVVSYRDPDSRSLQSLRLNFDGANPSVTLRPENLQAGKVNYLVGNDASQWKTNIPTFARIRYQELYRGVDAIVYGNEGHLEYDLVVAPSASTDAIRLKFDAAHAARIDHNGDLVVSLANGKVRQQRPVAYQQINGHRQDVNARFFVRSDETIGFALGAYDHTRELVIDPTLIYSTLIGATYINNVTAVAVDGSGDVYATGYTYYGFPTKNAFEGNQASEDAFVTKFSATGGSLIYSTYLGGSGVIDEGTAIGVDRYGSAYVVGITDSFDFPVKNAIQPANHGGRADAFAAKLNSTGSALVYSTYLGGSGDDEARGLAIDSQQRLYITGWTCSSDFPVANAYQPTSGTGACAKPYPGPNAFVTRLNASGTGFDYSTYLGGTNGDSASGIAVDSTFSAYVTGTANSVDFPVTAGAFQQTNRSLNTAFVTKFAPDGQSLVFSTFFGGTSSDNANAIAIDSYDRPYITGTTRSGDMPVTSGARQKALNGPSDAFVTKFWKTGAGLIYSTYLGGSGDDGGNSIAVDASGDAHVAGYTGSTDFPVSNALQSSYGGGTGDAFITKLSASGGSLVYSTYFGGSGNDGANSIRLDLNDNAYVGGTTTSTNFRTTSGAYQRTLKGSVDGWVIKIKP